MIVYIGNFGSGNWAWQECLRRHAIATMNDMRTHPLWERGEREAYITESIRLLKTQKGVPPDRNLASRWFNLGDELRDTQGDLWIHHQKDQVSQKDHLWWTISTADPLVMEEADDPDYLPEIVRTMVYYKPCHPWRNTDKKGRSLEWPGLHAKARDFLSTEATFQKLSPDYSLYAQALVNGDDLSAWHNRPEWRAKVDKAGKGPVRGFTAEEIAAHNADERMRQTAGRMIRTAKETALQSGLEVIAVTKDKQFHLGTDRQATEYALELMKKQDGRCVLTGLKLLLDGDPGDDQLRYSLDRIDSSRHYEQGNLQIVCRFVNKWKGAMNNDEFKRLLLLLRA